ncbi:hypothetical protein [Streptomyces sp. NBC_00212]|uniref:hypothetical protein n=1 Tax=Streptomyces sp. NBC_00212 TaxID=2975684 RepID=UPI0032500680
MINGRRETGRRAHGIPFEDHLISGELITPPDPNAGLDKNHDGYTEFSKPKQQVPPPPPPYTGPRIDAYLAFRAIWNHIQTRPYGNVGIIVDTHDLGELLGAADGTDPWELAWWDRPDCGDALGTLTKSIPFDWVENHSWSDQGSNYVEHRIRLGRPRLGRRRYDLRFCDAENIVAQAKPDGLGDDFANEVQVLGKGEGRAMARAQVYRYDGRLRRVATVADKTLASDAALRTRGEQGWPGGRSSFRFPRSRSSTIPTRRSTPGGWATTSGFRSTCRGSGTSTCGTASWVTRSPRRPVHSQPEAQRGLRLPTVPAP